MRALVDAGPATMTMLAHVRQMPHIAPITPLHAPTHEFKRFRVQKLTHHTVGNLKKLTNNVNAYLPEAFLDALLLHEFSA